MRTYTVLIPLTCTAVVALRMAQDQAYPRYLDPRILIERRIDGASTRMTQEEKVGQISGQRGSQAMPRFKVPYLLKTEGLHSQSCSTGATIFLQPIGRKWMQ